MGWAWRRCARRCTSLHVAACSRTATTHSQSADPSSCIPKEAREPTGMLGRRSRRWWWPAMNATRTSSSRLPQRHALDRGRPSCGGCECMCVCAPHLRPGALLCHCRLANWSRNGYKVSERVENAKHDTEQSAKHAFLPLPLGHGLQAAAPWLDPPIAVQAGRRHSAIALFHSLHCRRRRHRRRCCRLCCLSRRHPHACCRRRLPTLHLLRDAMM